MAADEQRRCTRCARWLALSEFPRNGRTASGLSSWCRNCHRAVVARWRAANPDYDRRYRERKVENR